MGALADLWKSERGLIAVLLIVGCTVLAALGQVTFTDWKEYTLYIFAVYAGAKTITSAVMMHANTKPGVEWGDALQSFLGALAKRAAEEPPVPPPTQAPSPAGSEKV